MTLPTLNNPENIAVWRGVAAGQRSGRKIWRRAFSARKYLSQKRLDWVSDERF
jgi:hypothetical protein